MENLWILTEEKPKVSVIKQIVDLYEKDFSGIIKECSTIKIKPVVKNNVFELSAKEFEENPFKNIRKYITLNGEYTGTVIAFPKQKSGIIVQLDNSNVTCMCRVPARFNSYPHFKNKVLIKVTEIKEKNKLIYAYLMRII